MKKLNIKIKKAPSDSMAYGGQANWGLDVSPTRAQDNPFTSSIASTLQPVDSGEANIEAELGETILGDFDGDGINEHMKVGGKRHSKGGTPLNAPDGAFVFSDTKRMKIGGDTLSSFGKSENSKKKFTPADLAKQYDVNTYKAILDDKNADPVKKRTAEMMIHNYEQKLAKLALVQEAMKGFPEGIPQIAMPYIMTQQGGEEQAEQAPEQSFKMGGELRKFAYAGEVELDQFGRPIDPYGKAKTKQGNITPTKKDNKYDRNPDHIRSWEALIPGFSKMNNDQAQRAQYQYKLKNSPGDVTNMWRDYGLTNKGKKDPTMMALTDNGVFKEGMLDNPENLKALEGAYADGYFGARQFDPGQVEIPRAQSVPVTQKPIEAPIVAPKELEANTFDPVTGTPATSRYWTQDKMNVMAAMQNRANLKKYMPWEAPVNAVTADPAFYDPTRELASNAEQMNTQMMYNAQFAGPQSMGARNSAVAGQAATNAADIMSRVNSQNVGVANQFAGVNAGITNQLMDAQAQRATRLFDKTTIANQQFDNSKAQANDVIRKNLLSGLTNKQKTQWFNTWYPQYNIDAGTGIIDFNNKGHHSVTQGAGPSKTYIEMFNKLKLENPNVPDDILKKQLELLQGSARNTIGSDGDAKSTFRGHVPESLMNLFNFQ